MATEKFIPWESLPITNTFIFNKVLTSDMEVCKEVIETLLCIKISRVERVHDEKSVDVDILSKGVRFDVYVSNSSQSFDVELQMTDTGELPLRARYYQSIADVDSLNKGMSYRELKETYIIFLCPFDLFDDTLPVHTFENTCIENASIKLNDKTRKVFYNFKRYEMVSDVEQKSLLEFLSGGSPESRLTNRMGKILQELQGNQLWRNQYMTLEMLLDERRNEGRNEGVAIGVQQKAIETARNALVMGLPKEQILELTGLSIEQIESLR